ncbi:MAG: hypothetical protein PVG61_05515 [Dehalococcoidia bacterium]|jgi:photosystem II stability/assembly factor-like uncharacterized protein
MFYLKTSKYALNGIIIIATVFLVLGLSFVGDSASITRAAVTPSHWDEVDIPVEGITGDWVLAEGSDIRQLASASDGTLYAGVSGLPHTLYKSGDCGLTWSAAGKVTDEIIGLVVSTGNPDNVYYATTDAVYRSVDAGEHFQKLPPLPDNPGTGNVKITSLAVSHTTADIIAIGTRDGDNSEYGGIYILDETLPSYIWTDSSISGHDVFSLSFSPGYPQDGQLIAVTSDETNTYVSVKSGSADWGSLMGAALLSRDNAVPHSPVSPLVSAAITFPGNYGYDFSLENSVFYVAVNTGGGNGDIYRINCVLSPASSIATDLNVGLSGGYDNLDIAALDCSGTYPAVNLIAGVADSKRIYLSSDGGNNWDESLKPPTGDSVSNIIMSANFAASQTAHVATTGIDSAFSVTRDSGHTWNQLSLIDNRINTIVDMVPSPDFSLDKTLFMITFGNRHSLWRTETGGVSWERILSGTLEGVDTLARVGLPPQSRNLQKTVFLAGESEGKPAIWESIDNGQSYRIRKILNPATGTSFPIDAWAIADETTLYIGSFDGTESKLFKTINSGFFFFDGVTAGSQPLNSIALSPEFDTDGHIVTGDSNGRVYWSDDGGESFQTLPFGASSPPLSGQVTVAFDADYRNNHTLYAAGNTPDAGIYRFTIGEVAWESIDSTLPPGAAINQLVMSDDGVLYAVNSRAGGGMERCLSPATLTHPSFETVTPGLSGGATLYGLWQYCHRLWSIDTTNIKLMTYRDTLTVPVTPVAPDNEDINIGNLTDNAVKKVSLDWETLEGATVYEWQCYSDTDFSSIPDGFEGTTQSSSVKLPSLEQATTYYWHVRAISPVLSPWSEKWSFTTAYDTVPINLELQSPAAGASDVSIKPLFQWKGTGGVDAYELVLGKNPDFSETVIAKENESALTSNAWQCEIDLDYDTAYFWKVRAVNGSAGSPWSSVGSFTTETKPAEIPGTVAGVTTTPDNGAANEPPPVTVTDQAPENGLPPVAAPDSSLPQWMPYLVGSQGFLLLLALIIIIILVARRRHY